MSRLATSNSGSRRVTARAAVSLLAALLAALAMFACNPSGDDELLCEPGENIFCRCRAGQAGTKMCRADGRGFDECVGMDGVCEESYGGMPSDDPSGDGNHGSGKKKLLEACDKSNECDSGLCSMGYCTAECASWQECTDEGAEVYADCVNVGPLQQCVPYCGSQTDCEEYGGQSHCGYAQAVDAVGVVVCADFNQVPLPPEGSECEDDFQCHLGVAGVQRVCEFDMCIGGCHEDDDCPEGASCTPGAPGYCLVN